jgi:hypothetical protein
MRNAYTDRLGETITRMHKQAFPGDTNMEFVKRIDGAFDYGEHNGEAYFHMVLNSRVVSCYAPRPKEWYCKL